MGNQQSEDTSPQATLPSEVHLSWVQISASGAVPSKREAQCSGIFGKYIFLFGGGTSSEFGPRQFNDLYIFDAEKNIWTTLEQKGLIPSVRTGATCSVLAHQQKLFVFGGLNTDQGWMNDLFMLDLNSYQWISPITTGNAPSPRDKMSCCAIGQNIYFFGGFGPQTSTNSEEQEEEQSATFGWFNDFYVFNTETFQWTKCNLSGDVPTPRAAFGMCALNSKIFIFGGRDTIQRTNDLYVIDISTFSSVRPITYGAIPSPRSFHTLTSAGNKLVVFGGMNRANMHLDDIHVFHTDVMCWTQPTVSNPIPPRGFCTACSINTSNDNSLVVFGGSANFDDSIHECTTYYNDMYSMNLLSIIQESSPTVPPQQVESIITPTNNE